MLKPRIKHKVSEIEEKREYKSRKNTVFLLVFISGLFLLGIFINNYINQTIFYENSRIEYKGLVFKLQTDKNNYLQGEKVIIKVIIYNPTNRVINIDFLTSEMVYYTVYSYVDLGITKFYYKVWTNKPVVPPVPKTYRLSIGPKQTINLVKVWDQVDMNGNPVKTGRYKFRVELNTPYKLSLLK